MVDRVALVTGGGRGIGLACVKRLLADGFHVGVVEINQRAIDAAREALQGDAERVHFLVASVTDRAGMQAAVADLVKRWGRLDALVNNAGVNRPGGIFSQGDDAWDAVLTVNLKGPFICTAVAAAVMREQKSGAVVNIGSTAATGQGGSPAYASSKAGLIGLTRQTAHELGPYGIRVNLVAPGVTATEWVQRNLGSERIAAAAETSPLRRAGAPEDIAAIVAFLVSPDARHLTGQLISASGGEWMP